MKRDKIETKISEIVEYWSTRINESELSIDFSEAHERCWRCGCERSLERAHIVPYSLGGEDKASNLVLLCKRCHVENPNVADPEIMWDWLKAYKETFYDTFWIKQAYKEYEKIYECSFQQELVNINASDLEIKNILSEVFSKSSYHFGHPYLNSATLAGILRMTIKKYNELNRH